MVETTFTNTPFTLVLFYSAKVESHTFIMIARWILECFPTFSFSMAFGQICFVASKGFSYEAANWRVGKHLGYAEYYESKTIESKSTFNVLYMKPIAHFVHCIEMIGVFFFVMFWYCDHIFSSNRGVAFSLFFPFQKSYWLSVFPFCQKKQPQEQETDR